MLTLFTNCFSKEDKAMLFEHPGCGEMIDDRDCTNCAWHDEECLSWNCDYISRMDLRKLLKAGVNLSELAKEVQNGSN